MCNGGTVFAVLLLFLGLTGACSRALHYSACIVQSLAGLVAAR